MSNVTMQELKNEVTTLSIGILSKLNNIQVELKAPKNQFNDFGKYNYRSCEDILEGVKPLLKKHEVLITINDEVILIGSRYYVKATAILHDCLTGERIKNSAYAREEENKKGMDGSQLTGTSSSYARKYALNGLLLIDDTKDADTNQHAQTVDNSKNNKQKNKQDDTKPTTETMNRVNFLRSQCEELQIYLTEDWAIKIISKNCNGKHEMFDMNEQELIKYCQLLSQLISKKKQSEI